VKVAGIRFGRCGYCAAELTLPNGRPREDHIARGHEHKRRQLIAAEHETWYSKCHSRAGLRKWLAGRKATLPESG
jgi:hypothetical protein